METTIADWVYIGIMEKKMETTIVYWVCFGIMEKKMETTVVYHENKKRSEALGLSQVGKLPNG